MELLAGSETGADLGRRVEGVAVVLAAAVRVPPELADVLRDAQRCRVAAAHAAPAAALLDV